MRVLSAWLLVSTLSAPALAENALPADAPPQAEQRYRIGVELYRAKKYADAAREFRVAFKLYPRSPKLAYNLARCLERSNQPTEAVEAYRRYLALAPKADDRAQVEGYIAALLETLPELVVTSEPPGARVRLDGEAREGATPLSLRVPAGSHVVQVTLGERRANRTVEVKPRQKNVVLLELPKPSGPAPQVTPEPVVEQVETADEPTKPWPWVAFGVGAAGLATGVVFSVQALDARDARDAAHDEGDVPQSRAHHDEMNEANTLSLVGYGVGAVGLAAGAALLLWGGDDEPVSWTAGPGYTGVRGRF